MEKSRRRWSKYIGPIVVSILVTGLASYGQFFTASIGVFNAYQAMISLVFWVLVLGFVLLFPLNKITHLFLGYLKSFKGFLIFASYLAVHLLVYGFILEGIVATVYPQYYAVPIKAAIVVTAVPIYPASFFDAFFGLFIYPNISAVIPPLFGASLSLYSIVMAVVIAILVVSSILKSMELKDLCSVRRKSTSFVLVPLFGVIGGASCCLSLPIFLALLAAPAALLASPSIITAYYIAYFLFPLATVIALKLNLDVIDRIGLKLTMPRQELH